MRWPCWIYCSNRDPCSLLSAIPNWKLILLLRANSLQDFTEATIAFWNMLSICAKVPIRNQHPLVAVLDPYSQWVGKIICWSPVGRARNSWFIFRFCGRFISRYKVRYVNLVNLIWGIHNPTINILGSADALCTWVIALRQGTGQFVPIHGPGNGLLYMISPPTDMSCKSCN